MSVKKLIRYRRQAFQNQSGLCYYCGFPMWENCSDKFADQHHISLTQAKRLQCTAEHLQARKDGGEDNPSNIVAACLHCNQIRHQRHKPPSPAVFQSIITKRLRRGAWHDKHVIKIRLTVKGRMNGG